MAKDIKSALIKSVEDERNTFNERFAKAESLLNDNRSILEPKEKPKTIGKLKMVRDSFTLPENDYALIEKIKIDCMKAGVDANKSEIIRAGLHALSSMNQNDLKTSMSLVNRIKPGRPKLI